MTQPEKREPLDPRAKLALLAVLLVAGLAGLGVGNSVIHAETSSPLAIGLVLVLSAVWVVGCASLGVSATAATGSKKKIAASRVPKTEGHRTWCGRFSRVFVVDSAGVAADHQYCHPVRE
jgi:hypothetical protein